MIKVYENIFCGNQLDEHSIKHLDDWVILHCCKIPYHMSMVGYKKSSLPPNHPDYKYKIQGKRMALNLVDIDLFNLNYIEFNYEMFTKAFEFLDGFQQIHNVLIHCNQGESRGPMVTMLYLKHLGLYKNKTFLDAYLEFKNRYPALKPKNYIYRTVESLWDRF
ncbi:MAG: hypothetical protein LBM03_00805 [Erysipelotrichaceae bacterium]|jgi:hypothetical protein|nr:hypothetical protein [Erysipelotrichaceae bacterium]